MKYKLLFLSHLLFCSIRAECSACEFYCNVLFFQPNTSNLYYGAEALPLPVPTPNWKSLEIKPDFQVGFDIGLKKRLSSRNLQLEINWERLCSKDSTSHRTSSNNMVGPYFNIGPDAEPYKIAHGNATHDFNAANLNLNNPWICYNQLNLNWFSGLSFAYINQNIISNFANYAGTITRNIDTTTQFLGFGPDFGLDFTYKLRGNFSLSSITSCALLMGSLKNHTAYESTTPLLAGLGITPPNRQKTNVPSRTQIVPAFSGKIDLSYGACCYKSSFAINIGYQVQAYLNAIQSVDMSSEVTTPPADAEVGVYVLGFTRTLSNFLVAGPLLSLNITF